MFRSQKNHGFTLIELLVVIAIIAILATILMPSLSKARRMAKNVGCLNNLKALHLGQQYYVQEYNVYACNSGAPTYVFAISLIKDLIDMDLNWSGPGGSQMNFAPFLCPSEPAGIAVASPWHMYEQAATGGPGGTRAPYAWNWHLGTYGVTTSLHRPDTVDNAGETFGWADAQQQAGFVAPTVALFGDQRIKLRHGEESVGWSDHFAHQHLGGDTNNTANASFLDGHAETLDIDKCLDADMYYPDPL